VIRPETISSLIELFGARPFVPHGMSGVLSSHLSASHDAERFTPRDGRRTRIGTS